jgi:hypothetical protein
MNTTESGREGERKAYTASVQAKAYSSTSCAFCWFVLGLYPSLTAVAPKDANTFREHLKAVHGLVGEIQP